MYIAGKFSGQKVMLKINEKPVTVKNISVSVGPKNKAGQSVDFDLSNIKIAEIDLRNISGKAFLSKKLFDLRRAKFLPKSGAVFLKGTYNLETTSYKLDILGKELKLEDFNQKYLQGPLNFQGTFFGNLLSENFKKGLSGNLNFNSEKGYILTAATGLSKILAVLNLQTPSNTKDVKGEVLAYDYLGANCKIKRGVLFTEDFKMESSLVRILGYGKVDLLNETLDAEVKATPFGGVGKAIHNLEALVKTSISKIKKNTVKKIPLLGDILTGEGKEGRGLFGRILKNIPLIGNKIARDEGLINIYFRVEGTFDEPNVYFLPQKTFLIK